MGLARGQEAARTAKEANVQCRPGRQALALTAILMPLVCAPIAQATATSHRAAPARRSTTPVAKAPVVASPAAPATEWGLTTIAAPAVWAQGAQGQGIVVAVVDSGALLAQRDLAPNLWVNPSEIAGNGIDDDHDGYVDDVNGYDFVGRTGTPTDTNGHGTHVAGIVAGACKAICGVAPQAKLMIIRVLDGQAQGDAATVAQGIRFAVDHGAKIVNLSLAGPDADAPLQNAIEYAGQQGVLVVVAAGNGAANMDARPSYPASFQTPNMLSVAAMGMDGRLGSESDFGRTVSIAAPGQSIVSTSMSGGSEWRTGTSMASPMVAGALADLWSRNPTATWQQLRSAVLTSATPGLQVGSGTLNLPAALDVLNGAPAKAPAKKTVVKKTVIKKTVVKKRTRA